MPMSDYIANIRAKIGDDILILPGTSAVVINDAEEVLLQLRSDYRIWTLLGGYLDPGEDLADCIVREVREEAGISVRPESLVAVLSGADHLHTYENGHQVAIVNICFRCRPVDDTPPTTDKDESLEVRYFAPDNLPDNLFPLHRQLIAKAVEKDPSAYFRPPST